MIKMQVPEIFFLVVILWAKVFSFIILGFITGFLLKKRLERFIKIAINAFLYVVMPVFVLQIMWTSNISLIDLKEVPSVALGVCVAGAGFAYIMSKLQKLEFRDVCLPVVFMNSAYLAIPVNLLVFGYRGGALTILYNIVITLVHFTVGIWWVRRPGKPVMAEIFAVPILYIAILGLLLNISGIPPLGIVKKAELYLSVFVLPMMLVFVGIRLSFIKIGKIRHAIVGVLYRMAGGFFVGWFLSELFSLTGTARGVVIITSAMPSAVSTYLVSEKFETDSQLTASMVALGTVLSIISVPFIAWFVIG